MKLIRKTTALFLALICGLTCVSFSASAKKVKTKNVTVHHYSQKNLTVKKTSAQKKYTFDYSIKNNSKNYIKVNFSDWGVSYNLQIKGRKITAKKLPVISIFYKKDDTKVIVKKFKVAVAKKEKVTFKDVQINKGTTKVITLKNPYYKDYYFKLSKQKVAKISMAYFASGEKFSYSTKGVKRGTANVNVYLKDYNVKVGRFKIEVGNFPTTVKKSCKKIKLKYNGHGSNAYMSKSHVMLADILKNMKAETKAKYSVVSDNENVVSSLSTGEIYATGKGTTTCTVYEKLGKAKKKPIDKFTVTSTKANMAYVASENSMYYDEGIFGQGEGIEYLNLTDNKTLNMKAIIISCLINNKITGSHFKSSLYKIIYKSSDKSVATVTGSGVVTAKNYGSAIISYTISFKDGSEYNGKCEVFVESEEMF